MTYLYIYLAIGVGSSIAGMWSGLQQGYKGNLVVYGILLLFAWPPVLLRELWKCRELWAITWRMVKLKREIDKATDPGTKLHLRLTFVRLESQVEAVKAKITAGKKAAAASSAW